MAERPNKRRRNVEPNGGDRGLLDVELALADGEPSRRRAAEADDTSVDPAVATSSSAGPTVATESFERFYRSNRADVAKALALTLRDTELASDAVDEAMARAYERWTHVRSLDNPVGWVYRVGLNWSRSFLRRARRRPPIWMTPNEAVSDASGVDPAVDRALGELSVDQRAVVVCRLLIGYSEAQTARALGIRPGTVKSRLNRASARLHGLLSHLDQA